MAAGFAFRTAVLFARAAGAFEAAEVLGAGLFFAAGAFFGAAAFLTTGVFLAVAGFFVTGAFLAATGFLAATAFFATFVFLTTGVFRAVVFAVAVAFGLAVAVALGFVERAGAALVVFAVAVFGFTERVAGAFAGLAVFGAAAAFGFAARVVAARLLAGFAALALDDAALAGDDFEAVDFGEAGVDLMLNVFDFAETGFLAINDLRSFAPVCFGQGTAWRFIDA